MAQPEDAKGKSHKSGAPEKAAQPDQPSWANGLRKLYDSVVSEPLPDSFDDLLKKLDQQKGD